MILIQLEAGMSVPNVDGRVTDAMIGEVRSKVDGRRWMLIGLCALVLAYLVYAWIAFDVSRLLSDSRGENFALLGTDVVMHKVHVVRTARRQGIEIAVEGERTATYKTPPDWVATGEDSADIDLGEGYRIRIDGPEARFDVPGYGTIIARATKTGVETTVPPGRPVPEWLSIDPLKLNARPTLGRRLQVTRAKIEVHRYFFGWENFWFPFGSELKDYSTSELLSLAFSGDRLDPSMPNYQYVFLSFWRNSEWHHNEVFIALFETILMAVLGTLVAAFVGLPLAILAASNFTPAKIVRFFVRRLFDFLRGIDMLIWSLIFIRAFGLGPLTGALAIAFTDTGTLGKLFSEALENVDKNQIEGVRSTGANQLQRYRFGVIPQILPVFVSQTIYYLESNTRSATVIGALGAGGIGLLLVETMKTQRDWENVGYIIVLTTILVVVMDALSSWLRRRLIAGNEATHVRKHA
jgi:phosphonate transport system permease protein